MITGNGQPRSLEAETREVTGRRVEKQAESAAEPESKVRGDGRQAGSWLEQVRIRQGPKEPNAGMTRVSQSTIWRRTGPCGELKHGDCEFQRAAGVSGQEAWPRRSDDCFEMWPFFFYLHINFYIRSTCLVVCFFMSDMQNVQMSCMSSALLKSSSFLKWVFFLFISFLSRHQHGRRAKTIQA